MCYILYIEAIYQPTTNKQTNNMKIPEAPEYIIIINNYAIEETEVVGVIVNKIINWNQTIERTTEADADALLKQLKELPIDSNLQDKKITRTFDIYKRV